MNDEIKLILIYIYLAGFESSIWLLHKQPTRLYKISGQTFRIYRVKPMQKCLASVFCLSLSLTGSGERRPNVKSAKMSRLLYSMMYNHGPI